ncbi:DUF4340 domain-containing protein [Ruminococcus sp.]|uniref:DUF4340 domain-containing protein n=1 Tax=Ruminococcus sp. TaxID=41978 RepID=UPI00388DFF25
MAEELKKENAVQEAPAAEEKEALQTDTSAAKPSGTDASEDALERFLSREQEEKKPSKPPVKKSRKTLFIILGAIAVVAILIVVLILVRNQNKKADETAATEAEITANVNADGVHEASVALDENGKLVKDGAGTLLSYATADIRKIDIENQNGSFTVTSTTSGDEATVYKIVGFEDFALQDGVADNIASHTATLSFTRVIAVDAKLADYGLDQPRATVKATFGDNTSAIIRVGAEAAAEAGTYLSFGTSDTVYLVPSENVADYLTSVNQFISLSITETNEDPQNAEFSALTISGSHFDKPITLAPNADEAIEVQYLVTEPVQMFANAVEASDIAGNVRGLYAESVVCVNPSENQLASYGLDQPYATVKATYPDTQITLSASAPDDKGIVNIYNPDKKVIYTIQLAAVCWAKTSVELLLPENPLPAKLKFVDSIDFSAGSAEYAIDVTTKTETVTGDDGADQEVNTSTAACNGKDLKTDDFNVFFQNLNSIKNQGAAQSDGGSKVMSVTLHYTTDRAADTLDVLSGDHSQYVLSLNGSTIGTVSKAYIGSLIEGADNLIAGNPVAGL